MDSLATKLLHDRAVEYYVEIYIGTPGQLMKLQFDMGISGVRIMGKVLSLRFW